MAVVSFGGSLLTFTIGILFFFTKIGVWEAGKTNFYTNAGIFTMIVITGLIGAALWTIEKDYSVHDQIEAADQAVYEAKRTGKNKYVLHTRLTEPENPDQDSLLEEENESA